MAGCLLPAGNESVTLSVTVVQALEQRGDGDAALLYLALLRHQGTMPPRALAGELRWERERIEHAEAVLSDLRLIARAEPAPPPEPAEERPEYTRDDIAQRLEHSAEFRSLTNEVERRLGQRLSVPDIGFLLELVDFWGLPPDVIYLLVCHCMEKTEKRQGPGKRPGMKRILSEGKAWAKQGIDTQAAAGEYLKRYAARQGSLPGYMAAVGHPERAPSATEEKYLLNWQEMGFPPETVAMAYDKTILRKGEMNWSYCNGILKRWHKAGLHTRPEVEAGDRPPGQRQTGPAARPAGGQDLGWMRKYVQERDQRKER